MNYYNQKKMMIMMMMKMKDDRQLARREETIDIVSSCFFFLSPRNLIARPIYARFNLSALRQVNKHVTSVIRRYIMSRHGGIDSRIANNTMQIYQRIFLLKPYYATDRLRMHQQGFLLPPCCNVLCRRRIMRRHHLWICRYALFTGTQRRVRNIPATRRALHRGL